MSKYSTGRRTLMSWSPRCKHAWLVGRELVSASVSVQESPRPFDRVSQAFSQDCCGVNERTSKGCVEARAAMLRAQRLTRRDASRGFFRRETEPKARRCKVLTEDSTPRRGRRVLPVTLGHHHKPFGSAGTARGLRALDLVGALHAAVARRAPWGARKRRRSGSANDTRLAAPACSELPLRARIDTGPAQRQLCGP